MSKSFGYRKPGTAEGSWNGAWVVAESWGRRTMALFEDNKDWIAEPIFVTDENIAREIKICTDKGWLPMSAADLKKTAGV